MQIHFVPDVSGSIWPGEIPQASFGEPWVGPTGFLRLLETSLGLTMPFPTQQERVFALVPDVKATDGFWSESATHDPIAVSQTLIHWRDTLRLHGWQGETVSARLSALALVTADAAAGIPDRLLDVIRALQRRRSLFDSVTVLEPIATLPLLWRQILDALKTQGVRIQESKIPKTAPTGDLLRVRSEGFEPIGDGSIQLLRPHGPLEAADELAAWLAAQSTNTETVIIGSDVILDRAFHRHGLPTTGSSLPRDNALLQLLPLVLELGWKLPNPESALEILMTQPGPVPRGIAWRLARALHCWPAVGSDEWQRQLAEGLGRIEDEQRRHRIDARLQALFLLTAGDETYPASIAVKRVNVLKQWLASVREIRDEPTKDWNAALSQCNAFLHLLEVSGLDDLTRPFLNRLIHAATDSAPNVPVYLGEAGFHRVASPAEMVGPADRIIWWSFEGGTAPRPKKIPFTRVERAALRDLGCPLPKPSDTARAYAQRWQRPFRLVRQQLVLICPEFGTDGEPLHPHPLWDEIAARPKDPSHLEPIVTSRPIGGKTAERVAPPLLCLPTPKRDWQVNPAQLRWLEKESPTSLSTLIGCSLKWALRYTGKLYAGVSTALPHDRQLYGSLVHDILSTVLVSPSRHSPEQAQELAQQLFDNQGPKMAAQLFWPGAEDTRMMVRNAVGLAAAELVRHVLAAGLDVLLVETEIEATALGRMLRGAPDVVLSDHSVVIDLKWGGLNYHQDQLEKGTAYQLAAYSHIYRRLGALAYPAVGYFILSNQHLLTTAPSVLPSAQPVEGPTPEQTFRALNNGYCLAESTVRTGELTATANPDEAGLLEAVKTEVVDDILKLEPPCRFCEYGVLCGTSFEGGDA